MEILSQKNLMAKTVIYVAEDLTFKANEEGEMIDTLPYAGFNIIKIEKKVVCVVTYLEDPNSIPF